MRRTVLPLFLGIALGCGGAASKPAPLVPTETPQPEARSRVVSWDILAREPVANTAEVRHILIGWRDLASSHGEQGDPRAAARSKAEAEAEVEAALAKLREGASFQELMASISEDQGSASSGRSYPVATDAQLVIEFKQLSLRLNPGELGVCQSDFGFHIIKRFQ